MGNRCICLQNKNFQHNPFDTLREPFLLRTQNKLVKKMEQKIFRYPDSLLKKDWNYIKKQLYLQQQIHPD